MSKSGKNQLKSNSDVTTYSVTSLVNQGLLVLSIFFSFILGACTETPEAPQPPTKFQKAVKKQPLYRERCQAIKAFYHDQCKDASGSICTFKDKGSVEKALQLLTSPPKWDQGATQLVETFLQKEEVTKDEVNAYIALLGRDCWSLDRFGLWKAAMATAKNDPEFALQVKDLLSEHVFNAKTPTPTLLRTSIDIGLAVKAVESGLMPVDEKAKQELFSMRKNMKSDSESMTQRFNAALKASGEMKQDSERADFDPEKVLALLKEEYQLVKTYRSQLKEWTDKNLNP